MSSVSEKTNFPNMNAQGEIPSFNGDEKAKATDFANYFCAYSQIYHQKSMLSDHQRMAAYHSAILGNQDVFRDKIVMDIGTGSGILSVWAAQAGARKVYAIEYTDMAKHAEQVMKANNVDHIVTVLQCAVEDVQLPIEKDLLVVEEDGTERCVDIIISEWMGYMLLRESMMDSVIHARDRFLKKNTGLMFPSHTTMLLAPITDEEERKHAANDFSNAIADWNDFEQTTNTMYGVDMSILSADYEREQKEYYMLSSRWTELPPESVLAEPAVIKRYDMMTCTLQEAKGLFASDPESSFDFEIEGSKVQGPVSGFSGWFTADFCSRTDHGGVDAPKLHHPAFLSTGPENGYTHWGQQTFYFLSSIPTMKGETTRISGGIEMTRTKDNSRLYNCRLSYSSSRRKSDEPKDGAVLMKSGVIENVYQIP